MSNKQNTRTHQRFNLFFKKSGIYLMSIIILFVSIGFLTTVQPAYRLSIQTITEWTSDIDSSTFLYLFGIENRAFQQAYPNDQAMPNLSTELLQIATSIKPNDPRSLLGNEIPGFSVYDRILIAGEGTNYANMPVESSPPLEEVLREREAVFDEEEKETEVKEQPKEETTPTTEGRNVVFIYNTHNRESFLPHLPDVTNPDHAHHDEVNITKVSERFAQALEEKGIGSLVDDHDFMNILNERDWGYGQSYQASREIVEEAMAGSNDLNYVFDIHRDSISRDKTTTEIDGESYGRILFVVGAEHEEYEKNLELAKELHNLLEDKYPGISRGYLPLEGARTNGIFNQDLNENALLFEFGGVENTLEELYRSADILAEVFSEYYWDAEAVDG
ncbi:stage II sporulation protein P [Virgibacillus sp. YIM 98842]|jgi:stage II sporulation protein P|uniref:stage II sporulation protein P n=1 Tax=Virgibacillus sp. YIM 98842 TaxID=2663533 RepID=UPI0013DA7CDE|nr:stage II sporulation protein P [Virgibacillus sp. YIM 98842]